MSQRSQSGSSGPIHQPVMLREVIKFLDLQPGLTCVDGTVGAGGHSAHIVKAIEPGGRLLGFDRDPMMLEHASKRLENTSSQLIHSSYVHLREQLDSLGVESVDRIVVDLGLSSDQLADRSRGFGFKAGGTLDLRFDTTSGEPASELLARISESDLAALLVEHGDERFSREIAAGIVQRRKREPIETTEQLSAIVEEAIPGRFAKNSKKHPSTRVVQALRIAVNDELEHLQRALESVFFESLCPGGRLVVLSFHSIEDRMVKQAFRKREQWQSLTPKPVAANAAENRLNPRARSAKLRAAIRL